MVPLPRVRQLADLVQAEHLLNSGQRRKFLWGNVSQVRLGESAGEQPGDLPPPRLQQRQGVQGERVEEATAAGVGVESASTRVGSRRPVGVTGVPSTSPIECAWSVDTISTRSPARASRTAVAVASVDLPTPPLPTKRLIRARAPVPRRRRGWAHSASTRFFRSFNAVSVSLRSALRLSSPIIGMIRSTDSS